MTTARQQAETLFHTGNQQMEAGDDAGAERSFLLALAQDPGLAEAHANLAYLHERAGDAAAAEARYRRALALSPDCLQIALNLGSLLLDGKRFAEAEAIGRQALQIAPGEPAAWSNLGVLLACMKREDEAEQCYRIALALDDGYDKARFNLSYILLRQGRFDEGWRCLEARNWYEYLNRHFTFPRWRGEALTGKSLVITIEAGHGDMIQLCRYAAVLKSRGASRIAIICHPGLTTLFRSLQDVDAVFSITGELPSNGWDYWSPPLSLPRHCRTDLDSIPARIPYLAADPARIEVWSRRLSTTARRVGLVWKGSPGFENDADRSLPSVALLAPLASVPGIQFVSLQKGRGEDEIAGAPLPLLPLGGELQDFAETAAVVSALDLVISVDTAVAHLAGALGKPCWLLLPDYRTDWRWLTERTDTPWYPTLRLFRQPPGGGWEPVMARVEQALREWVAG